MVQTDEQRRRERFEADCLHIDEGQLARTEAGDYATEWVHGTWIGYSIAYKARDAEVQRLLTALANMTGAFHPSVRQQEDAHEAAVMLLAEYLPEKEAEDE